MATVGRNALLSIGAAGSTPPVEWKDVKLRRELTRNSQKEEIDITTADSGGNREFLPGLKSTTFDGTCLFDPDADGIKELLANYWADDTVVWFRYRPQGEGASLPEETFEGFVTNATVTASHEDAVEMSFTIRVTGKVTQATQSS